MRRNGLNERDLSRIVRRVINEQSRIESDQDVDAFIRKLSENYSIQEILDLIDIISNDAKRERLILLLQLKTEEM